MVADRPVWWLVAFTVVSVVIFGLRLVEVLASWRDVDVIARRACGVITAVVLVWGVWLAWATPNPLGWMCWYIAVYVALRIVVHLLVRLVDARCP